MTTIGDPDPFAERMADGYRQLYETARESGSGVRGALAFTCGNHRTVSDLFPGDAETQLAAEYVLDGADLAEAGRRARRVTGDLTGNAATPLREGKGRTRPMAQQRRMRDAARRLGADGHHDVRAFSEAVGRREDAGATFTRALADTEAAVREAAAGGGKRTEAEPAAGPTPTTVADYQRLGLSEADARAAARRR